MVYRDGCAYNADPAKVERSIVAPSGSVTDLRSDIYTYTEANDVRRVEIRNTAARKKHSATRLQPAANARDAQRHDADAELRNRPRPAHRHVL